MPGRKKRSLTFKAVGAQSPRPFFICLACLAVGIHLRLFFVHPPQETNLGSREGEETMDSSIALDIQFVLKTFGGNGAGWAL